MKRTHGMGVIVAAGLLLALATVAGAAEPARGRDTTYFWVTVLTGGFGMAIASAMAAFAQGRAVAAAVDAMARQPNAAGRIMNALIIGLAFIESLAIYVLVIAFILFFLNPFSAELLKG